MSIALEMEGLIAIDYSKNHTALNTTLLAWIAFLTAAISFSWKIKSSIHSSHHLSFTSSNANHQPQPQPLQLDDKPSSTTPHSLTSSTTFSRLENRKSGKFSVYYGQARDDNTNIIHNQEYSGISRSNQQEEEEDRGMGVLDYDDDDESMTMGTCMKHNNCKDDDGYWEVDDVVLVKMKIREMRWYSYQDLSALDGNVVRLWTHQMSYVHSYV